MTIPSNTNQEEDIASEQDESDKPTEATPDKEPESLEVNADEDRTEGLEAGEAAALAKKKVFIPKPIECCITLNR